MDACEDRNAYGNNTQWCLAAKNVPTGGINTKGQGPGAFDKYILPGIFDTSNPNQVSWTQPDCYSKDGQFTCTNLAGKPMHFDIAMKSLTDQQLKRLDLWPFGTNPIVVARKIKCPKNVTKTLQSHCGANAGTGVDHCFWCPRDPDANQGELGSLPSQMPGWWGGCDASKQQPQCARMNAKCGGEDWTGPTCCQWPEYYECKRKNEYYSGCEKKSLIDASALAWYTK